MKPSTRLIKQSMNNDKPHPNFMYDASSGHNPGSSNHSMKKCREDIDRIHQDLQILTQKIAEVRGDSPTAVSTVSTSGVADAKRSGSESASSPFVTGMRSMTESERTKSMINTMNTSSGSGGDLKDVKISTLENLLEKIGEYDRLILARTIPLDSNHNNNNSSSGPQRRKSFSSDLHHLPTHFRVVDRLMDLYNSSKRVTVLRQTVTPPTSSSTTSLTNNQQETPPSYTPVAAVSKPSAPDPALQRTIDELKVNLQKVTQKCELSESRRIETEHQLEFKTKDYETLQKKYDLLVQQQQQQPPPGPSPSEWEQLQRQLSQQQRESQTLQEKLEIEISYNQRLLNLLMNKVQAIERESQSVLSQEPAKDSPQTTTQTADYTSLPENYQLILKGLDTAIANRLSGYQSEVQLVLSLKDMIESEMQSVTTQKDLLSKDFHSLQEEHEALKTAYHSLSYETATANRSEKSEVSRLEKEMRRLQDLVTEQSQTIERLERDQTLSRLQQKSIDHYEGMVRELQEKVMSLETQCLDWSHRHQSVETELQQYQLLTDNLKQKLKDLTKKLQSAQSQSQVNPADFFDTFEEVMKDEMMSMKLAFEAKLKIAREETDALQKKHQQEILKMQRSTPSLPGLLNR